MPLLYHCAVLCTLISADHSAPMMTVSVTAASVSVVESLLYTHSSLLLWTYNSSAAAV